MEAIKCLICSKSAWLMPIKNWKSTGNAIEVQSQVQKIGGTGPQWSSAWFEILVCFANLFRFVWMLPNSIDLFVWLKMKWQGGHPIKVGLKFLWAAYILMTENACKITHNQMEPGY